MITDYKVIVERALSLSTALENLSKSVGRLVKSGWQPYGPLNINHADGQHTVSQVVVACAVPAEVAK